MTGMGFGLERCDNKLKMEKLIVCETDRGRWVVRPIDWEGVWDKNGKINDGLHHTAVFLNQSDAQHYADLVNAETDGLLVRLPCKVGDTVYFVKAAFGYYTEPKPERIRKIQITERIFFWTENRAFSVDDIGEKLFLSMKAAESALKGGMTNENSNL